MTEPEIWRDIVDLEGVFAVSSHGRIKRIAAEPRSGTPAGLIRKLQKTPNGYQIVSLRHDGKARVRSVHRIVMTAFFGPSALQVNHKDGNKKNNHLENLEYVTPQQNAQHARDVLHVHKAHGETHCRAKLSTADVLTIRARYAKGASTQQDIADDFGVSRFAISLIVRRKNWKHL